MHIGDLATAIGATTAWFVHLIVMAQAGDQLTFEFATRMLAAMALSGTGGGSSRPWSAHLNRPLASATLLFLFLIADT
ncbi:hypothetical protein ACFS07_17080 [Undibacterium arcticum]